METPECDRMHAVVEDSQKLGEFLDWLAKEGLWLCELQREIEETCSYKETGLYDIKRCEEGRWMHHHGRRKTEVDDLGECPHCHGTGYAIHTLLDPRFIPQPAGTEDLLARYFNIDLDKVEQERRAILKVLQS